MTDEQKWTKEPWEVRVWRGEYWPQRRVSLSALDQAVAISPQYVHVEKAKVDFDRAAACVNALAGIENPGAVQELVEAARAVCDWDWSGLGAMLNHADWVPALADIERLEKALSALDQKEISE